MVLDRAELQDQLTGPALDVLVVGGGIVGAGIARDAAMRGLRVGLVEQFDLAGGTSSRSSRLLHGGLRYLAQGRLGLVYEASREKRILCRIAPHLAEPLAFLFPAYRGTRWPLWQLRVGVKLYDLLCGGHNLGPSSWLRPAALAQLLPDLRREGLSGAVRYYDGLTNDARLVLDTLHSAHRHGAMVLNYARFERAEPNHDRWRCEVRDELAGQTLSVTARSVVNAAGPWAAGFPQSSLRLRPTKGVHLVVDRGRLPVPDAVVMAEGSRILFAIPWGQRVILGTTDTDYDGPPQAVRADPADVRYILDVVNASFPAARLGEADVVRTWAGLRPLIADRRGRPSDISRRHVIRMPQPGWLDVAGGKLTTYRLIAQQAVDRLARHLGGAIARCRTAAEPLYDAAGDGPPCGVLPPDVGPQPVQYACRHEWAVHLDDVMLRRTSWHYYHADAGAIASQVAAWMAEVLGWDAAQRRAELARYETLADGERGGE